MKRNLFWIGFFYAAYFGFVGLYSPFLGPYLKSIGHSLEIIALALGMMQLMRIFGPFLWGWVADRSGKQIVWMRVGSTLGLFFSLLALTHAQSPFWLIAFILFLNLSISGLVPLSDSYAMYCCEGDTGHYGRVRLFGSVGFVASVLGFGAWADWQGFDQYPIWVWMALLGAVVASLNFRSPEKQGSEPVKLHRTPAGLGVRTLLWPPDLRLFWVASFFMIFAHGVFYAYFSLYLLEYQYTESVVGLLWAVGVVLEICFFAVQGRLYTRMSHTSWLCLSFFACFVRFGLIALFPELFWVVFLAQAGHCLTFAAHHTATVSWLRERLPAHLHVRGQAMYATLAYGVGGTSGTFAGEWTWSAVSPSAAFYMAAISGLVAFIVGCILHHRSATHP